MTEAEEISKAETDVAGNTPVGSLDKVVSLMGENGPKLVPSTIKKIDEGLSTYLEGFCNLLFMSELRRFSS